MSTPIRLPLSQRQADALAEFLDRHLYPHALRPNLDSPTPDEVAALHEVAEKLDTLREK